MPNNAYHHIALRVQNIERAAQFYVDAFDAHWMAKPSLYLDEFAGIVMGGVEGCQFKVCILGMDTGIIELFEFLEPVVQTSTAPAPERGLLHFCVQVDDVAAALERVEAAGGERHWPQVETVYPGIDVIYVTDPDGNVVELISGTMEQVVAGMIADDPSLAPDAPVA
jgi:catechol 2,3-dioxygenase-like lactoylglutathione lyase family enzyme